MNARYLVLALLVHSPYGWQPADQTLQAKLVAVSGSYSVSAPDWLHALTKVAGAFQLPMGVEWIKEDGDSVPYMRSWRETTPLAILQDLLKARPGYVLEIGEGVVHVLPTAMKGDRADVLNANIGMFEVRNQAVTMAAYGVLAGRVRDIMVPPDPGWPKQAMTINILGGLGDGVVSFRMEHATVRDVLDKLCLGAGLSIWIVAYPPTPVKTRAGFLKTVPLVGNSNVSSDSRFVPSWQFLPWGSGF